MRQYSIGCVCLGLLVAACSVEPANERSSPQVDEMIGGAVAPSPQLAAARALVGHYTGTSTIYGINAAGEIEKKYDFREDITAKDPQVKDGRSFVTVTDTISGVPRPILWTEGFHLNADGTIGDRYFLLSDPPDAAETIEKPLGNTGAATFDGDFRPHEEIELGFGGKDIVYKKHTTVKNVVTQDNLERHIISRVSTISWRTDSGAIQTKTFVSMNGYQDRTPTP